MIFLSKEKWKKIELELTNLAATPSVIGELNLFSFLFRPTEYLPSLPLTQLVCNWLGFTSLAVTETEADCCWTTLLLADAWLWLLAVLELRLRSLLGVGRGPRELCLVRTASLVDSDCLVMLPLAALTPDAAPSGHFILFVKSDLLYCISFISFFFALLSFVRSSYCYD